MMSDAMTRHLKVFETKMVSLDLDIYVS